MDVSTYAPLFDIRLKLWERDQVFSIESPCAESVPVMPAATASQLEQAETMRQGWLSLPDLPSAPHQCPHSVYIDRNDGDKDARPLRSSRGQTREAYFPCSSPPKHPNYRSHSGGKSNTPRAIQARFIKKSAMILFDLQKTVGLSDTTESPALRRTQPAEIRRVEPAGDGQVVVDEPEWVPGEDGKKKGIWRRSVHFTSLMALPFAPNHLECGNPGVYKLQITIPFPGVGNDLKLEVPIQLNPSAACPPPGSSNLT
ncbi:hypothetical protein R3P38DRAFT_3579673, partial [Favolaschia claudopus]